MIPLEAQHHLDDANALFPDRYTLSVDEWGRTVMFDQHKTKSVGVDADPVTATRKGLHSARLSANNGNRKPNTLEWRRVGLSKEVWAALDAEAAATGVIVSESVRQKLS
jgi:hypothetical protein